MPPWHRDGWTGWRCARRRLASRSRGLPTPHLRPQNWELHCSARSRRRLLHCSAGSSVAAPAAAAERSIAALGVAGDRSIAAPGAPSQRRESPVSAPLQRPEPLSQPREPASAAFSMVIPLQHPRFLQRPSLPRAATAAPFDLQQRTGRMQKKTVVFPLKVHKNGDQKASCSGGRGLACVCP